MSLTIRSSFKRWWSRWSAYAPKWRAVLDSVTRERPDVILLDLMMPGLDGFQVTRKLKGDPVTASIPIVAVSAMARPDDREAALAAGCDEFVRKPFELDDLEAVIRTYLED